MPSCCLMQSGGPPNKALPKGGLLPSATVYALKACDLHSHCFNDSHIRQFKFSLSSAAAVADNPFLDFIIALECSAYPWTWLCCWLQSTEAFATHTRKCFCACLCKHVLEKHEFGNSDLHAHHRQLDLPAGQGPFLCLPSALTLIALQRWLCLMAPTSTSGQQLHCRMPLACKLAPVHSVLLCVKSALHASREAVNMLNMSHSGDIPLCCSSHVCHSGKANLYDAALHFHACCMHLCSE